MEWLKKNPQALAIVETMIFIFVIVSVTIDICYASQTRESIAETAAAESDSEESVRITYTSDHYKGASVWLSKQGITTIRSQLESYAKDPIDGDTLYGVLRKGVGSHASDTVLLRMEGQHPLALPSGTLIVLPDRCVIFNGGTTQEVWGWDPTSGTMRTWSMRAFKSDYISAGGISYLLLPRGYNVSVD